MIELVNTTPVTVPVGQSIPFSAVATKGGCAERHRAGSAQITLVKPGRYLITFSGNVAVPTEETVGEVAAGNCQRWGNSRRHGDACHPCGSRAVF